MNDYQKEQAETLTLIRNYLSSEKQQEKENLFTLISDYLTFRTKIASFLACYFIGICQLKCYQSRLSACCGKEGIITFFADMLINALMSSEQELDQLELAISRESEFKCMYLGDNGCIWKIKPIVCEMFLCETAIKEVFEKYPGAKTQWNEFKKQEKFYKWPDRPVLFDRLEKFFINKGHHSPLMYFHNSPGLLHIKKRSGLL